MFNGNNWCGSIATGYRPDLMAVIVVGDVDRDHGGEHDHVAFFIAHRAVSRAAAARRSTCRSTPARATPSSPTRKRRATTVELSDLRPARNQGTVGGYRDIMRDQLFADMLGDRLDELTQSANAPFLTRWRGS